MTLAKKLILAAIAALALAALGPASASAASSRFEAAKYPATVSSEAETHTLSVEGGIKVKCKTTFSGQLTEPSESLTLAPTYSECTLAGLAATVTVNSCQYVFKTNEEKEEKKFTGTTDISCPAGKNIVITALAKACEVTVGSQSALATVTYLDKTESSPPNIRVEENLSSVKYTVSKDEGACPFSGTGEKTNGAVTGNSTLKGSVAAESVAMGVVSQKLPTRLCSAMPEPNGNCPAGKALAKATITGSSLTPAQPATLIKILNVGALKNTIECQQSNVTANTTEEMAAPLKINEFWVTFAKCITVPAKTACGVVEMTNAPQNVTLSSAHPFNPGDGMTSVPFLLRAECGAEIEKCTYERNQIFALRGGTPTATLEASGGVPLNNAGLFAGEEKNCFTEAKMTITYEITAPKPLWVSR